MSNGFAMLPTGHAGLQAVVAATDHTFPRHTHDEFGIGIIVSGGQISASGRGQVTARAGDIITVNPGEVHDGAPLRGESRRWTMLYLAPELLASIYFDLMAGSSGQFEFQAPVFRDPRSASTFKIAFSSVTDKRDCTGWMAAEQALISLLATLVQGIGAIGKAPAAAGILRAKALVDDNPTRNFSLEELSVESGLSRFQTLRGFQAATGLTPHAYLMQRRISLAKQKIAKGSGLADVAAETGYADQSHMTREFKRRYGLTPAAYRHAIGRCNSIQDMM